ncbi:uncharacterized protein LOC132757533 [Ruditapes philippinarum]|uniref:uncharacterized protein LOC132757533 n=1 Tax=Ruditapes philippinarum TaxID=129788 RepID=UPI00295A7B56|nr:uncharacterized protein LOC132757533 [Ruditapes philippinarum]
MPRFAHIFVVVVLCTVTHGYRKEQDDDVLRVENNPGQTFQGCMLRCIDKDLCCSCKESAKLSMNAAMINDFIKTCPEADDSDCTEQWITSWMNVERGGASNCTMKDNVKRQINQCTARCKGKPMSQPLNPHQPLDFPGQFSDLSELLDYNEPDFNEFCMDIRTEGILCTVWSSTALLQVIRDADKILHAVIMVTHTNGATPTPRTTGTIAVQIHAISMVTTTCGVSLVQNGNIVATLDL